MYRFRLSALLMVVVLFLPSFHSIAQNTPFIPGMSDYNIVYLVNENNADLEGWRVPGRLHRVIGAQAVDRWEDVLRMSDAQPIDALIVDVTMADEVDRNWLSASFADGLVLGTFNMTPEEIQDLTGNDQVVASHPDFEPYPTDYYFVLFRLETSEAGSIRRAGSVGQHEMASFRGPLAFASTIRSQIESVRQMRGELSD
jgi:hypothetical protein